MQAENLIYSWVIFCSVVSQAYLYEDYTEYILDSAKVCSQMLDKKIIRLGYDNKSGVIVRQESLFDNLSGQYPFTCVFTIDGGGAGIAAVIQKMNFRTYVTEGHNVSCRDYIQFAKAEKNILTSLNIKFTSSQKWSTKYCGEVNLSDNHGKNMHSSNEIVYEGIPIADNTFIEPTGLLDVKIYIGIGPIYEKLQLEMAFTSFQSCKYNMGSYKMCGGPMCIWKDYFNDGVVNCPFLDCTDEFPCGETSDSKSIATGLGTKVLLGTVAGIFTLVFVLILFFWTFHYCNVPCTPRPPAHLTELGSVPPWEDELGSVPPGEEDLCPPTVTTPLGPSLSPSFPEEKDLPPAYETLFPETAPAR